MATVIPAKAGIQDIDNTGFPVKPEMTEMGAGDIFTTLLEWQIVKGKNAFEQALSL